ncbi:MAG: hypothetical protein A2887_03740 [Alphaproteobacteria bacterium RIFCSPLOWO2_01_FULL_40_26]|nr:MAG: hypothetical protein A3D15_04895 [Alphaproteobacteria bacterium RIFCSPHIGHO2_02_FULL_40_34]OFW88186.1 MAG: hypothetical protein A2794_05060 [Alphaproteobacteria bacterium RIFCSPHIGHO2_01_FULL_40_8]OFW95310.1 MAG: hypothetical protein A2887_03740 [Alphaproteobacteria bacterium RIFCSPLOWO2_01_FULL_40_26]OFX09213.1 MAG: hypothetical protein A3H30_06445 [Alphaproteobacteria bacterium RIFCSPLOWO2_02_FULL_40_19]OFX11568.1 MAG: hypothetical protein A3G22_05050 [Alphaproteobacteria bacterium RI
MNILFLGYGKMGSILAQRLDGQIKIIRRSSQDNFPKNYQADLVFLCIKPQGAEKILAEFSRRKFFHKNTIFISILAGKKIAFFEKIFGKKAKIIRSMPNLPIQYLEGIFAYLYNKNISKSEVKNLEKIFQNFGEIIALKNEKDFDAITAIFGSGPAYIFLLQEIFEKIAVSFGITSSAKLVKKLFLGSALMAESATENFAKLRQSVTSKNGTTEAALKILQKNSVLEKLFKKSVNAAIAKSKKLSKE